jgi:hypothetical protein
MYRHTLPLVRTLVAAFLFVGPASAINKDDPGFVGAGDIAQCWLGMFPRFSGANATASLLDGIEGVAGPGAPPPPSPGNHDYRTAGAAPYYAYFGENAGPPGRGYYSYDIGAWHIVSLNSNLKTEAGAEQERWLRADLAARPTRCTLAYWHHPAFSSGPHGDSPRMRAFWSVLYEFGVDVVVNGHDHHYERFAPQTPDGAPDVERGIRQFTVGTGGADLYDLDTLRANSEVQNSTTWGVLKFTLRAASYDWEFIPVAGGMFRDRGTGLCVP